MFGQRRRGEFPGQLGTAAEFARMQQHDVRTAAALEIMRAHAVDVEEFALKPAHSASLRKRSPHPIHLRWIDLPTRGRYVPAFPSPWWGGVGVGGDVMAHHCAATAIGSGWRSAFSRGETSCANRVRFSTVSSCDIGPAWPIIKRLPMPPQ